MTTETTYYASVAAIKEKLNLHFPVNITLPDPITGEDWTVVRADIYNLLLSDPSQLLLEGQTVASLYLEAARMQRACSRAASKAEIAYRHWRSQLILQTIAAADKKPAKEVLEATYRADASYEAIAGLPDFYNNLANLFGDLKDAFSTKANMISGAGRQMAGYERTVKVERSDDGDDLDRLNEMAEASIAEGRKAAKPPKTTKTPKTPKVTPPPEEEEEEEDAEVDEDGRVILADDEVCGECEENPCVCPVAGEEEEEEDEEVPPPPPEEEEEEEEEDEGEEEEEEEEEDEPPPPAPVKKKKTSKRKPGKSGSRDGKNKKATSKRRKK